MSYDKYMIAGYDILLGWCRLDDCVGQYDDCGACNGSDLVFDNYCQNDIDFINVLLEVNGLSSSYSWSKQFWYSKLGKWNFLINIFEPIK